MIYLFSVLNFELSWFSFLRQKLELLNALKEGENYQKYTPNSSTFSLYLMYMILVLSVNSLPLWTVRYLFLTGEDIMSLPCFQVSLSPSPWNLFLICWFLKLTFWLLSLSQNQTLIAIKAPQASNIEVPDPSEVGSVDDVVWKFVHCISIYVIGWLLDQQDIGFHQRQCNMTIRSTTGPIDLYLLRYSFMSMCSCISSQPPASLSLSIYIYISCIICFTWEGSVFSLTAMLLMLVANLTANMKVRVLSRLNHQIHQLGIVITAKRKMQCSFPRLIKTILLKLSALQLQRCLGFRRLFLRTLV